jgi:nicotinic acid mononucleotide adenylyltransferase
VAHLELAKAAAAHVDEVLLVVPSVFPHKDYSGATMAQRVDMLELSGLTIPHSIAITRQGLFKDIARECREHYPAGPAGPGRLAGSARIAEPGGLAGPAGTAEPGGLAGPAGIAGVRLYFLCGRDAAEWILGWDYGRPGVVEEMLQDFELLVAPRGGHFEPPPQFRHRIHSLALAGEHDSVSSSEVRERIARGQRWEHLVPEPIVELVRAIYS